MSSEETYHFVYFKECNVELWTNLQKEFQNDTYKFHEQFYFLYSLLHNEKRLELNIYNDSHRSNTLKCVYEITSIPSQSQQMQESQESQNFFPFTKNPITFESLQSLIDNLIIKSTTIEIKKKIDIDKFPVVYSYDIECKRSIYSYMKDEICVEFVYDVLKNTLCENYYIQVKTRIPQLI